MSVSFYLDILMIVLLVVTIIYSLILNRRLAAFRRNREDMEQFLAAFNAATERAESLILSLKEMASDTGDALREDIDRATGLHEDLSFMVDRGESIANRLEKAASGVNAARKPEGGFPPAASPKSMSRSEGSDIIDDRVGIETRAEELAARMVRDAELQSGKGGYENRNRKAPEDLGADQDGGDEDAGRSEAERELLAALRSVR